MMAISGMIHDCRGRGGKEGPIVREIEEEGWSHNHGSFLCTRQFRCPAIPA
jgi:hypothetical protein